MKQLGKQKMTVKQLLERLERIKDSLADVDNRYGIEGTIDDINQLRNELENDVKIVRQFNSECGQ